MPENNFIYQDHYILAEQQEVSHDNSLSGNGTVNSPLGLSNEYNYYTAKSDIISAQANTGFAFNVIAAAKQGNIVNLSMQFDPMNKLAITANTWQYIFTLNPQFVPAYTVLDNWSTLNSTASFYGNFKIETDGKVYTIQQNTIGENVRLYNTTYFTP